MKKTWFSVFFFKYMKFMKFGKIRIWVKSENPRSRNYFSVNFRIYIYESCRKKLSPKLVVSVFRDESDGNYREKLGVEFWKKERSFRIF